MAKERTVVNNVIDWLNRLPDGRARKVHGGPHGQAGEPDVDACVGGRAVKLEVKAPGGRRDLTRLQQRRLDQWREAGAVTGVVESVDDVRWLLAEAGLIEVMVPSGGAACCRGHADGRLAFTEGCG